MLWTRALIFVMMMVMVVMMGMTGMMMTMTMMPIGRRVSWTLRVVRADSAMMCTIRNFWGSS